MAFDGHDDAEITPSHLIHTGYQLPHLPGHAVAHHASHNQPAQCAKQRHKHATAQRGVTHLVYNGDWKQADGLPSLIGTSASGIVFSCGGESRRHARLCQQQQIVAFVKTNRGYQRIVLVKKQQATVQRLIILSQINQRVFSDSGGDAAHIFEGRGGIDVSQQEQIARSCAHPLCTTVLLLAVFRL